MYRSINEPIRSEPSFDERWGSIDLGLITSWERGRVKSMEQPKLAEQALAGQLIVLPWKGGACSGEFTPILPLLPWPTKMPGWPGRC